MSANKTLRDCVKDPSEAERGSETWWNKPIIPFIPEDKDESAEKDTFIEITIKVNDTEKSVGMSLDSYFLNYSILSSREIVMTNNI